MKKFKKLIPVFVFALMLMPCVFLMTACTESKIEINQNTTVETYTDSNIEKATNKAMMSAVSIYAECDTIYDSRYLSMGSGVIYKLDKKAGDAYIITNYHVLYDDDFNSPNGIATQIYVEIYGREGTTVTQSMFDLSVDYGDQIIEASFVEGSLNNDLAIIKISNSDILRNSDARAVEVSDSPAHLGQTVIAIGNPLGRGLSATKGIVSVESEYITYSDFHNVTVRTMRIDAPINGGNSGGGLFDEKGRLIGIVNASTNNTENMNYAIPLELVTGVVDNILYGYETGKYSGLYSLSPYISIKSENSRAEYDEKTGLTYIKEDLIVTANNTSGSLRVGNKIVGAKIGDKTKMFNRLYEYDEFMLNLRKGMTVTIIYENFFGELVGTNLRG